MVLSSHPIWCQDYRKSRAIDLYLYSPVHLWHVVRQTLPFLTILILSSHLYPGFPSDLFPLGFLTKHLCTQVSSPPYVPHALPIFLFDLINKTIFNEHTPRSSLCNFTTPSCYFFPRQPSHLPQHPMFVPSNNNPSFTLI